MNKKLSLDRTQLKIIAIISMVIDHSAWGFLDFYTPLAQFLHVCGRFTVPIMCFFIAEGFRKTHDLKRYIFRMATYAVVSTIPFYIFFHEEYGYRQNIIFDLLLGLLLLTVLESKLAKWQKILLTILLFGISMTIGGWIIEPMLFILIFYYGRSWKEKVRLFIIADVAMVALLVVAICLNNVYHFSHYEWVWWDKFYLLGFMLALPLLKCYNGEKGKPIIGRHFFYIFYPAHFLVLSTIKAIAIYKIDYYTIYAAMHIVGFLVCVLLLALSLRARPSVGQMAISIFLLMASLYVFGFILEIFAASPDGYYLACLVQYLGEYGALIAALYFVAYMCRMKIPVWVIALHIEVSIYLLYKLLTTRETGFFYKSIGINTDGPFNRPELVHSTGFFISFVFILWMCTEIFVMCLSVLRHGTALDRKRVRLVLYSIIFCWLPYIGTLSGLTKGYEIPAAGLFIVALFLYLCFIKYGTLDSVTLAGENALDHSHEGIVVIDSSYRIQYHNSMVDSILGEYSHNEDVRKWPIMNDVLTGKVKELELNDRIYEFQIEPLVECGFEQGKMVWIIDSTEHISNMKMMSDAANRDGLTGLYNRTYFKTLVDDDVDAGRNGSFLMMDMDNFKMVNDHYGHQRGDNVLKNLAKILASYSDDILYACRVGGDEFCAYLRDVTDRETVEEVITYIMKSFNGTFRENDEVICTISIGAYINKFSDLDNAKIKHCSEMYQAADKLLYKAKESGKNKFVI